MTLHDMDIYSYHEGGSLYKRGFASLELSLEYLLLLKKGEEIKVLPLLDSLLG